MEMSGEYRIKAPRAAVWAALNDPAVLKAAIPGCKQLTKTSGNELKATVEVKVGMVKALLTGSAVLSNLTAPAGYTITGEGKAGVAGSLAGTADVKLSEVGGETILRYFARGEVGGKLAGVGARLLDAAARKAADQFVAVLASRAEARQGGRGAPARAAVRAAPPKPKAESIVVRAEHAVENAAHTVVEVAQEAEYEAEEAAVRGFLGGPQMWALLALAVVIVGIIIFFR